MKHRFLFVIFILSANLILSTTVFGQNTSEVIGRLGDKVVLYQNGNEYLVEYQNKNLDSENTIEDFSIRNKETLDRLYTLLIKEFESMNPQPIEFALEEGELRIYYIKRLGRNQAEIIHEDNKTEKTGTIARMSKKDIQKLFDRK